MGQAWSYATVVALVEEVRRAAGLEADFEILENVAARVGDEATDIYGFPFLVRQDTNPATDRDLPYRA